MDPKAQNSVVAFLQNVDFRSKFRLFLRKSKYTFYFGFRWKTSKAVRNQDLHWTKFFPSLNFLGDLDATGCFLKRPLVWPHFVLSVWKSQYVQYMYLEGFSSLPLSLPLHPPLSLYLSLSLLFCGDVNARSLTVREMAHSGPGRDRSGRYTGGGGGRGVLIIPLIYY